jgi:cobyrinic acid a,c-diamide synthase
MILHGGRKAGGMIVMAGGVIGIRIKGENVTETVIIATGIESVVRSVGIVTDTTTRRTATDHLGISEKRRQTRRIHLRVMVNLVVTTVNVNAIAIMNEIETASADIRCPLHRMRIQTATGIASVTQISDVVKSARHITIVSR